VGTWDVTGKVLPDPDKILSLHLNATSAQNNKDVLERLAFFAWNPGPSALTYFWASTCGHMGHSKCARIDDRQVAMTSACTVRKLPLADHTIMTSHTKRGHVDNIEIETCVHYAAKSMITGCNVKLERKSWPGARATSRSDRGQGVSPLATALFGRRQGRRIPLAGCSRGSSRSNRYITWL